MIGLVLLLFRKRPTLGFSFVALSLLLYMGFLFLELALIRKIELGDWVSVGIWAALCAIATESAWLLRQTSTQP
jgi:hypothetical protein